MFQSKGKAETIGWRKGNNKQIINSCDLLFSFLPKFPLTETCCSYDIEDFIDFLMTAIDLCVRARPEILRQKVGFYRFGFHLKIPSL